MSRSTPDEIIAAPPRGGFFLGFTVCVLFFGISFYLLFVLRHRLNLFDTALLWSSMTLTCVGAVASFIYTFRDYVVFKANPHTVWCRSGMWFGPLLSFPWAAVREVARGSAADQPVPDRKIAYQAISVTFREPGKLRKTCDPLASFDDKSSYVIAIRYFDADPDDVLATLRKWQQSAT